MSHEIRSRPVARGKFLYANGEKLYVRGVTYGTFGSRADGSEYPEPSVLQADFVQMAAAGVNTIRTYTVPPRELLDMAARHGLYVMVGLPWEHHVTFLDDRRRRRSIEERTRAGVRACAGHPAVLCYVIGNEIPSGIARWHGPRRIERFLKRLWRAAKSEDPDGLVAYVNYPSTEYLDLSFADLLCFNVFLESRIGLESYLARLQILAGDRPLLMTEIGLDSHRNGEDVQAGLVSGQLRACFAGGCAGAFVFSWTDDWHRGGHEITDWAFGLTDRERRPKSALKAVSAVYHATPFSARASRPRISVVVCTYNGGRTLGDCLEGVVELEYPDFEVIVVDDGSTDASSAIAEEFGARVIRTENRGLASARNTGLEAATGQIVAYVDDDARPDRDWLAYLAETFATASFVGVGGPNLAPGGEGIVADCVARTPGGPTHVLLSDREAEHIPGCNMAFRKDALEAIGGFDPQFRIAGDDVDVCWRLQEQGWRVGFSPAAVVWHRRRRSLRTFWRQQRDYGRAEALLERKWPERYNVAGHISWAGRLYARAEGFRARRRRVEYGVWGTGAFQTADERPPSQLWSIVGMPEWYLVIGGLGVLAAVGGLWRPLLVAAPLALLAAGLVVIKAFAASAACEPPVVPRRGVRSFAHRTLTIALHLAQPLARLRGRLGHGLTPWRRRGPMGVALPFPRRRVIWSEGWASPESRLQALVSALRTDGAVVLHGGSRDRWDLEIRGGAFGTARLRAVVEEHGSGKQLARFAVRPRVTRLSVALVAIFAPFAAWAAADGAVPAAFLLGGVAALVALSAMKDSCQAVAAALRALRPAALSALEAPEDGVARGSPSADLALLRRVRRELGYASSEARAREGRQ